MKVKFLKNGKLWIVFQPVSGNVVFSHENKSKCYEWIFKTVNYA